MGIIKMKQCNTCHQWKETSEYNKNRVMKDGLESRCRDCRAIVYYESKVAKKGYWYPLRPRPRRSETESNKARQIETSTKLCPHCKQWKPLNKFHRDARRWDNLQLYCYACVLANPRKNKRAKAWKDRNKDKVRQSHLRYVSNPEVKHRLDEYNKRYSRTDNGKAISKRKRLQRRTRKVINGGHFSPKEWLMLCQEFDFHCINPKCWEILPFGKITIDHVIPISKEGSNGIENIQPLCKSCNCKKKDKTIDYRSEAKRLLGR